MFRVQIIQLTVLLAVYQLPNFHSFHSGGMVHRGLKYKKSGVGRVTVNVGVCVNEPCELLRRYSSLDKLLRVTDWYLRFRDALKCRSIILSPRLIASDLRTALFFWIQQEQNRYFSTEIIALKNKRQISKRSTLIKLTPFFDGQLLRVGGRLKHSLLTYDEKHPLILPPESMLTTLIIRDCHLRCLHGGVQLTLGTLRQSYWILRGRSLVRALIHRCIPCVRNRRNTQQQLMGDLPSIRITLPERAFINTGVDYAGPINVRTSKGRGHHSHKAWICIFICCASRSVHLELVSDYTAEAFLAAYIRFTSRRGLCRTLSSDEGTYFVGADRQLREMFSEASAEFASVATYLTSHGTQWRFNPPAVPHFGGLWEAAVKSTKFHLRRVIGETKLTFEEMTTLLTQIEACLNSRPLRAQSDDPTDISALTPGHFLIGGPLDAVPEPSLTDVPSNRLTRWQLIQQMRDHFWKRWSAEYLKELQPRSKWTTSSPSIQIGDLVLIRHENIPPTQWPMGRVLQLHPGKDGLVRVVTLKRKASTLDRPIVKLCLLPRSS